MAKKKRDKQGRKAAAKTKKPPAETPAPEPKPKQPRYTSMPTKVADVIGLNVSVEPSVFGMDGWSDGRAVLREVHAWGVFVTYEKKHRYHFAAVPWDFVRSVGGSFGKTVAKPGATPPDEDEEEPTPVPEDEDAQTPPEDEDEDDEDEDEDDEEEEDEDEDEEEEDEDDDEEEEDEDDDEDEDD